MALCVLQLCFTVSLHHDLACMAFTHHKLCDFLFRCSEKMIHRRKYFSFQRGGFFVRRFQYNKNMYDSMCEWWWWWGRSFRNDPHAVFAFDRNSLLNIDTNILDYQKLEFLSENKKKKQNKRLRSRVTVHADAFSSGKLNRIDGRRCINKLQFYQWQSIDNVCDATTQWWERAHGTDCRLIPMNSDSINSSN